jgi:tetratricopeptide (TPR) repeat protein
MASSKHFVPRLVAATALLTFAAVAPLVAAQGPRNKAEFSDWCRSQGLEASYYPPRCNAASTGDSDIYRETPPTREQIEERNRADARRRQARVLSQQENARYAEIDRVWRHAFRLSSATERGQAFRYTLELARRQQAIRDGTGLHEFIEQVEALILWTDGVINDENGNYLDAADKLDRAIRTRPALFSDENRRYLSDVILRWRGTARRGTVTLVSTELVGWNSLRMFFGAPEGVSERVRAGFQAVEAGDWNVAKAWFQDALSRDPTNSQIRAYLEMDPETSTTNPIDANVFGQPLPETFTLSTLEHHAPTMSNEQIRNALYNIVLIQREHEATRLQIPAATARSQAVATCADSSGVVQTNPGACTAEADSIAGQAPCQHQTNEVQALDQLQHIGTGRRTTGAFDGGCAAASDTTASGSIVIVPTPDSVRVLSPTEVARYRSDAVHGAAFRRSHAAVQAARANYERAETRRLNLNRQRGLATDARIQGQMREAERAVVAARAARETAVTTRQEVIMRIVGAPIIIPADAVPPTVPGGVR